MLTFTGLIYAALILFALVSGLVLLWRRGAKDLDAWGTFVVRVFRGDRRRRRSRKSPDDAEDEPGLSD